MLVKINELCPPNIQSALKQGAQMKSGAPQKNFRRQAPEFVPHFKFASGALVHIEAEYPNVPS